MSEIKDLYKSNSVRFGAFLWVAALVLMAFRETGEPVSKFLVQILVGVGSYLIIYEFLKAVRQTENKQP